MLSYTDFNRLLEGDILAVNDYDGGDTIEIKRPSNGHYVITTNNDRFTLDDLRWYKAKLIQKGKWSKYHYYDIKSEYEYEQSIDYNKFRIFEKLIDANARVDVFCQTLRNCGLADIADDIKQEDF